MLSEQGNGTRYQASQGRDVVKSWEVRGQGRRRSAEACIEQGW